MQAVLNATPPILGQIPTGSPCGVMRVFPRTAADSFDTVVCLALPAFACVAPARITPAQIGQVGGRGACGGSVVVKFVLGFWPTQRRTGSVAEATGTGLLARDSPVGFPGLPLCLVAFGRGGLPPAIVARLSLILARLA